MKAYVLYSGGLDSILAIKLMQQQKIPLKAVHFTTPFFDRSEFCKKVAFEEGFELEVRDLGEEYIRMLRSPKHGYGSCMNPCLDCHIIMLQELSKMAKGGFIVTGEVLGQRPISQKSGDFELIEKELGLEGKILRPLSAKLLPETEAEKEGIVDRSRLYGISGRQRNIQFRLARKFAVEYLTPAGGCLLTEKEYSHKLKDLLEHKENLSVGELKLLKKGRHFQFGKNKIIVGRNEQENHELEKMKAPEDFLFEAEGISPISILSGPKTKEAIEMAAKLTLMYSDEESAAVKYGKNYENKISVEKPERTDMEKFRII
ncbi:MAG: hypothetical protein JW727_02150 [Candidatus Aenigmarchaeota archaeon]|nr:hypothetical protein [Candidatus Aenigmarchaeota archaeon]